MMGQALRATGRPIIFSLCNWGGDEVWKWAASAGGHMWRTTGDINDSWESVAKCGFSQGGLDAYAGPDRWNDPDMLVVGMYGKGNCAGETGCNDVEYRTHMSLWCLLASPLMIGCDVRNMTPEAKAILTAPEVLAVDQDPLGRQARNLTPETHNVQILDEAARGRLRRGRPLQPRDEGRPADLGRVGERGPRRRR